MNHVRLISSKSDLSPKQSQNKQKNIYISSIDFSDQGHVRRILQDKIKSQNTS